MESVTLADVQSARRRIEPYVRRTPLARNETLSAELGTNVYLKLEMFQRTGAFKVRGAFNKMLTLSRSEIGPGVIAVSGGNHGQAVACAAQTLGFRALILVPDCTPRNYVEATRGYGAEVVFTPSMANAFKQAEAYEREGWVYIHPFDDPLVIAGQGTLGLEIAEDLPEVTDVVVSIGGGGLISGVATALKAINPHVRIWGVETRGADSMAHALSAGRVVELPEITSIARTLGAPAVCEQTLAIVRSKVESVTVVSDDEAVEALQFLLERVKVVTEPAASCTLAAARRLRSHFSADRHVVLLLCGGNVAMEDLARCEAPAHELANVAVECSSEVVAV